MGRQLGEELDVVPRPVVELAGKPCGHALKELPGHVPIQSGERGWSALGRACQGCSAARSITGGGARVADLDDQPPVGVVFQLDYERLPRILDIPEDPLRSPWKVPGDDDAGDVCNPVLASPCARLRRPGPPWRRGRGSL